MDEKAREISEDIEVDHGVESVPGGGEGLCGRESLGELVAESETVEGRDDWDAVGQQDVMRTGRGEWGDGDWLGMLPGVRPDGDGGI